MHITKEMQEIYNAQPDAIRSICEHIREAGQQCVFSGSKEPEIIKFFCASDLFDVMLLSNTNGFKYIIYKREKHD